MTQPEPFTVTVPNMPGQPADHYEGPGKLDTRPTSDPTDDTYMGPDNDPTDNDYQEYADD